MTPAPDPREDDPRTAGGAAATDAGEERYRRRRLIAGSGLLLIIAFVWTLLSAGGSGHTAPAPLGRATTPGVAESAASARHRAAAAAEQAREEQAIQSALGYTAYVTAGSAGKREIALTFDDGPGPFTTRLIRVLRRLHVPATFFLVGTAIKDFGSVVPDEVAGGFAIGNHTRDHSAMAQLSRQDQMAELLDQASYLRDYGVAFPHLFRPPYGSFNTTTLAVTKKLKLLTILWTIDTADFRQPGVDTIVKSVISGARPGAIVLMHDAGGQRTQTIAALPRIAAGLRHRGFALVTVPRLLADDPPLSAQVVPPSGLSGG